MPSWLYFCKRYRGWFFFLPPLSPFPSKMENTLHMYWICWGLGKLEGRQEGKYLELKILLGFGSELHNMFFPS